MCCVMSIHCHITVTEIGFCGREHGKDENGPAFAVLNFCHWLEYSVTEWELNGFFSFSNPIECSAMMLKLCGKVLSCLGPQRKPKCYFKSFVF